MMKLLIQLKNYLVAIGKEPVEVAEAPGFVVNRILNTND